MATEGASHVLNMNYTGDWQKVEQDWKDTLSEEARHKHSGDLVGEIVRWPRADGYAEYIVASEVPLVIEHLHYADAWTIEPALIRGLILSDIKAMVDRDRAIAEMFR